MGASALRVACLFVVGLGLFASPVLGQACTDSNGAFRFLNDQFPALSTNGPVFVGQLVVANADGPVTFSLDLSGGNDPLPPGLILDADSGLITGLATQSGNYDVVFVADDTTQQISHNVSFSVSSSGGGGNGGSGLDNPVFPDGRVGVAYSHAPLELSGDGPTIFGGSDLPPGLALNGATGQITGTPTSAGTFFASLTVHDFLPGEENVGTSVVPITIHPLDTVAPLDDYNFEFVTQFLNNGEVGTSFCDQLDVQGEAGTVAFGASGLPAGLSLEPTTGAVTGTPTEAGTFLVTLTADDGTSTITTNLSMVIAPDATSDFHWNFLGLPAALEDTLYDRQPPIVLTAEGAGGTISYSAVGLPAGLSYDANSGEISGTPTRQGEYPVTFTASDGVETIALDLTFIVLPATGGDVSRIVVNFWVARASLKLGADGGESWRVSALYNADRRTGIRFDPATDVFRATIGSHVLQVDPGECTGTVPDQACSFKSPSGVIPVETARLTPDRQTLAWSTGSDSIAETVPGPLWQTVTLGDDVWSLLLRFDPKGGFRPALAFDRTAFVLSKGAVAVTGPGLDSAKVSLLLADPNFAYEAGVSTLRVRILDGATVLLDRDFTALGGIPKTGIDSRTGKPWVSFKTLPDAATTDRVALAYSSSKGAMKLQLSNLDLAAITDGEAHLAFEVTVGDRVYTTNVTFFETSEGKYGLAIP
jgi:putative Ig domain-containing protein